MIGKDAILASMVFQQSRWHSYKHK